LTAGGQQHRQPKIQNLQPLVRHETQVSRLQVPMNKVLCMGCFESFRELNSQAEDVLLRQRAAGDLGVQRDARDVLRDQVVHAIVGSKVENRLDVGVIQLGKSQRFAS